MTAKKGWHLMTYGSAAGNNYLHMAMNVPLVHPATLTKLMNAETALQPHRPRSAASARMVIWRIMAMPANR